MFAIRERWCLRRKESVDVLVLLDYLKQVKLLSFFLSSCDGRCYNPSYFLLCFIRSLRVATLSSSRFFPLVLGCGQQTSS